MFMGVTEHLFQTNRETVDLDKMYTTEFYKLKLGLYKLQNIKRKVEHSTNQHRHLIIHHKFSTNTIYSPYERFFLGTF